MQTKTIKGGAGTYDSREGVLIPNAYRRSVEFCSPAAPAHASDMRLKPSLVAFHEAKAVNMPTERLIGAAKELLTRCNRPNLITVNTRESAVAVLFGIGVR